MSERHVLAAEPGAGAEPVWEATVACSVEQAKLRSHVCPCPLVAELCCLKLRKTLQLRGEQSEAAAGHQDQHFKQLQFIFIMNNWRQTFPRGSTG